MESHARPPSGAGGHHGPGGTWRRDYGGGCVSVPRRGHGGAGPADAVGGGGVAAPPKFIFMTLQNTQLKKGALPLEKTGLRVGPETLQNTLAPANLVGGVA